MKTIERTVPASAEMIWDLWTTPEGIAQWWAPDGFRTTVSVLDLRPDGELVYTMTAEAPEVVAFMEQNGLPLATESRKYFTELDSPSRIAYRSVIDFVPDHAPYEHLTVVDLMPVEGGHARRHAGRRAARRGVDRAPPGRPRERTGEPGPTGRVRTTRHWDQGVRNGSFLIDRGKASPPDRAAGHRYLEADSSTMS